jgi:hypothetical protein
VLQTEARAAVERFAAELRQAYTGDEETATFPIEQIGGTSITFLSPDRGQPFHLRRIHYQLASGRFERAAATSTDTDGWPWDIGALGPLQRLVGSVRNTPVLRYFDTDGDELAATSANRTAVRTVRLTLVLSTKDPARSQHHLRDGRDLEGRPMTRTRLRREEGAAIVLVVFVSALLAMLGVALIERVVSEEKRSAGAVKSQTAFQAAEAGVDDYVSKLVDDHAFYYHYVHPAESTRRSSGGVDVVGFAAWTHSGGWTYPNGADRWKSLPNGYEYNLRVSPPSAGSQADRILATGRRTGSTTDVRALEVLVRPSNLADFYRLSDDDVDWGEGASTYGKIYVNGDVDHRGTAYADIYAEGSITGGPTMVSRPASTRTRTRTGTAGRTSARRSRTRSTSRTSSSPSSTSSGPRRSAAST